MTADRVRRGAEAVLVKEGGRGWWLVPDESGKAARLAAARDIARIAQQPCEEEIARLEGREVVWRRLEREWADGLVRIAELEAQAEHFSNRSAEMTEECVHLSARVTELEGELRRAYELAGQWEEHIAELEARVAPLDEGPVTSLSEYEKMRDRVTVLEAAIDHLLGEPKDPGAWDYLRSVREEKP
jgi:chromosome segregation ATPase